MITKMISRIFMNLLYKYYFREIGLSNKGYFGEKFENHIKGEFVKIREFNLC